TRAAISAGRPRSATTSPISLVFAGGWWRGDGGQHNFSDNEMADARRTAELAARGFKVLRFWNVDVFQNLEGVVDMIRNAVKLPTMYSYQDDEDLATPTPDPSPQGGGERWVSFGHVREM